MTWTVLADDDGTPWGVVVVLVALAVVALVAGLVALVVARRGR